MNQELLSKEELIETGYDYGELEMEEPPSDRLLVPADYPEEGNPVTGLVYDLGEEDGTLLYYGEYEEGLPHGISVDFHRNGRPKRICRIFRGGLTEKNTDGIPRDDSSFGESMSMGSLSGTRNGTHPATSWVSG